MCSSQFKAKRKNWAVLTRKTVRTCKTIALWPRFSKDLFPHILIPRYLMCLADKFRVFCTFSQFFSAGPTTRKVLAWKLQCDHAWKLWERGWLWAPEEMRSFVESWRLRGRTWSRGRSLSFSNGIVKRASFIALDLV